MHLTGTQLTPHSLYAAVSVGLDTDTITSVLDRLSKVGLGNKVQGWAGQERSGSCALHGGCACIRLGAWNVCHGD
jgi:uncharacterized protein YidB (DUF937 family)